MNDNENKVIDAAEVAETTYVDTSDLETIIEDSTQEVAVQNEDAPYMEVEDADIVDIEVSEAFAYSLAGSLDSTIGDKDVLIDGGTVEANDNTTIGLQEVLESIASSGDGGTTNHSLLNGRELSDQHPIDAITGLRSELDEIEKVKRIYSSENGVAEFREWKDGNPSWDDRTGYFVKLVADASTGIEKVAICTDDDDVYGVAVKNSGFVGNQTVGDQSDNPSYAMVGIVGLLRVRTDGTAIAGDYIVPDKEGKATKSDNDCGYKVVSTGSYPSYEYVSIAVTPQNDKISRIYGALMKADNSLGSVIVELEEIKDDVNKVVVKVNDLEEFESIFNEYTKKVDNIEKIVNDATGDVQQALENAQEAIDQAHSARDEALAAANDARNVAGDLGKTADLIDEMQVLADYSYTDEDGNVYTGAAGVVAVSQDNNVTMAALMNTVNQQGHDIAAIKMQSGDDGASIQNLVAHVDRYSVGELSLSYNLSRDEADSILTEDYIYVPTHAHEEKLEGYTVTDEETGTTTEYPDVISIFESGYAYSWNSDSSTWTSDTESEDHSPWIKGQEVSTAIEYSDGTNVGDLWFCWQDVEHIVQDENGNDIKKEDFLAGTLYRWQSSGWVAVATTKDNYQGRMMTSIKQTADKIESTVLALDNSVSVITQEVDKISSRVADAEGNISTVDQRVDEVNTTISNINDKIATLQIQADDNTASITAVTYGTFHIVYQSFLGTAPSSVDGNKYSAPPTWNETTGEFEFSEALVDANGIYYFYSDDKTKYVKVTDDGYEVYTVGNKALSAIDSRISETEASISETNKLVTSNSEAITNVTSKADENAASITSLTEYNTEQDEAIAAIEQTANENGAMIGMVVDSNGVKGDVIISAINGESVAQIDASRVVFSVNTSGEEFLDETAVIVNKTIDANGVERVCPGTILTEYIGINITAETPMTMTVYGIDREIVVSDVWEQRVGWYDADKNCLLTAPISLNAIHKDAADGLEELTTDEEGNSVVKCVIPYETLSMDVDYIGGEKISDSILSSVAYIRASFKVNEQTYTNIFPSKSYARVDGGGIYNGVGYEDGVYLNPVGDEISVSGKSVIETNVSKESIVSAAPGNISSQTVKYASSIYIDNSGIVLVDPTSISVSYNDMSTAKDTLNSEAVGKYIYTPNGRFYYIQSGEKFTYKSSTYSRGITVSNAIRIQSTSDVTGISMTGSFPFVSGQTIRTKGINFDGGTASSKFVYLFSDTAIVTRINNTDWESYGIQVDGDGNLTYTLSDESLADTKYIAFAVDTPTSWDNFIVTIDEELPNVTAENVSDIEIYFGEHDYYGQFRMILNDHQATIQNGELLIRNPYNRILLNPDDGIRVQTNTNIIDGIIITKNPIWTDMFYTETGTGNTYAGGWLLSSGSLSSGSGSTYVNFNSDPEQTYTLWAGAEDPASAKFSVKKDGTVKIVGGDIEMDGGSIKMSGGSISWDGITSGMPLLSYTEQETIAKQIMNGSASGTFINGHMLYSPTIYSAKIIATEGVEGTYATMTSQGFEIYDQSTTIPKMTLLTSSDATTVRISVGSGTGASGSWDGDGKLILEKTIDSNGNGIAQLYYQVGNTPYGFKFDSSGVTMLGGGNFDVGSQSYAVFG